MKTAGDAPIAADRIFQSRPPCPPHRAEPDLKFLLPARLAFLTTRVVVIYERCGACGGVFKQLDPEVNA